MECDGSDEEHMLLLSDGKQTQCRLLMSRDCLCRPVEPVEIKDLEFRFYLHRTNPGLLCCGLIEPVEPADLLFSSRPVKRVTFYRSLSQRQLTGNGLVGRSDSADDVITLFDHASWRPGRFCEQFQCRCH